uniref:Uncharacterized protein n=1 Tax=Anguilla anguilla TaxID=7936 RepID=A0A0E9RXT0_ANGAN
MPSTPIMNLTPYVWPALELEENITICMTTI